MVKSSVLLKEKETPRSTSIAGSKEKTHLGNIQSLLQDVKYYCIFSYLVS